MFSIDSGGAGSVASFSVPLQQVSKCCPMSEWSFAKSMLFLRFLLQISSQHSVSFLAYIKTAKKLNLKMKSKCPYTVNWVMAQVQEVWLINATEKVIH